MKKLIMHNYVCPVCRVGQSSNVDEPCGYCLSRGKKVEPKQTFYFTTGEADALNIDSSGRRFKALPNTWPCRACGDETPIECDLDDFDPDMHYCGKDPWCCP